MGVRLIDEGGSVKCSGCGATGSCFSDQGNGPMRCDYCNKTYDPSQDRQTDVDGCIFLSGMIIWVIIIIYCFLHGTK